MLRIAQRYCTLVYRRKGDSEGDHRCISVAMTVPLELASLPQWVCWKYVTRKGKTTKVPHRAADGVLASATRVADWCTLQDALEAAEHLGMDGVGFVFSKDDPY